MRARVGDRCKVSVDVRAPLVEGDGGGGRGQTWGEEGACKESPSPQFASLSRQVRLVSRLPGRAESPRGCGWLPLPIPPPLLRKEGRAWFPFHLTALLPFLSGE